MNELDQLFTTSRALGDETRFSIYRHLWETGRPASAGELAERFDLHPNAIRQHLARLEQAGLVVSERERSPGAGRPRQVFRRSPDGSPLPPRALLGALAQALEAIGPDPGRMQRFGREWAVAYASNRRKADGPPPRGRSDRAAFVARELAAWGCDPSVENGGGVTRVVTHRCIFEGTAEHHSDAACALEEGLVAGMVQGLLRGRPRVSRRDGGRLSVTL